MDINDVYEATSYLVDQYQGVRLKPSDFNKTFNMASRQLYNSLIGGVEQFQLGRPIPRIGIGMGQNVSERLSPFLKINSSPTVVSGLITKPSDLARLISINSNGIQAKRLELNEIDAWVGSVLDAPSATTIYYVEIATGYKIYPSNATSITISYVARPTTSVWGFTTPAGRPVYNVGTSVQPQWRDEELNDIIYRQLGIIGINTTQQELIQASQTIKAQGE